jgi:hypothetical protein
MRWEDILKTLATRTAGEERPAGRRSAADGGV